MVTDEIQKVTELEQEVKQKKENTEQAAGFPGTACRPPCGGAGAPAGRNRGRGHDGRGRGPGAGLGAGRSGTGPAGLRGPQGADAQPAG